MSYILEALKKADAERKLGAVPGLHMQSVPTAVFDDTIPLVRRPLAWGALALILASAILLAWYKPWIRSTAPMEKQAVSTDQTVQSVAESSLPAPTPLQTPQPELSLSSRPVSPVDNAPLQSKEQSRLPANGNNNTAGKNERKPSNAPRAATASPQVKVVADAAPVKTRQGTAISEAQSPEPQVPALRDLPEQVQRTLPQVTVGGYIYSSKPAERSMLINNRLVREGEPVSSGLILETMLPNREAILNYQGQRYRLSY